MILQSLVDYYEELAARGEIARPGWAKTKVSWALELDEQGELIDVLPFRYPSEDGKRMLPREMEMPAPVKRSSGISANFLWDNSSYILGLDTKGNPKRSLECFEASKALHLALLANTDDAASKAIREFFQSWNPSDAGSHVIFMKYKDELLAGDNITFIYNDIPVSEISVIRDVWQRAYDSSSEGNKQVCLLTGHKAVPELVHPAVKNVRGAQSSGAALVSFNAPAFCSFGKEQNINAPIGKYAAFAYTSALNYLLADRNHVKQIGNTTVVYWSRDAGEQYRDLFAALLDGAGDRVTNEDLDSLMEAIAIGKQYNFDGLPVVPDNEFFILGISPNAARLSVRFFYRNTFGQIVEFMKKHYEDQRIVTDNRSKWDTIPLWALLRETTRYRKEDGTIIKPMPEPLPQLSGDVLRSMITGGRYPETLVNQTLLRIRAEHDITRGRAGIIKAYLIRNTKNQPNSNLIQEVAVVSLNEESGYTPYVLGRLFAVLEGIQQTANPGISATIKDRFFNSACATPAAVFPILLKLSNSHLKKLDTGKTVYWSKQIAELTEKLGMDFPAHQTLQEQGAFILGYYHQTQKRFEKKTNSNKEEE